MAGTPARRAPPGLCAGLLLAALPTASRYAQEARSFAFVMAVAVLATGVLVKALSGDSRVRRPVGYAVLIALLGWFNLVGLLLVAAHAATIALRRPGRRSVVRLLSAQAAGIAAVAPPAALAVGVPWLFVPPLLLAAVSLGHPLFSYRYLLFCLPALALLLATAVTVAPERPTSRSTRRSGCRTRNRLARMAYLPAPTRPLTHRRTRAAVTWARQPGGAFSGRGCGSPPASMVTLMPKGATSSARAPDNPSSACWEAL